MARPVKFVITVSPTRRTQSVTWKGIGTFGQLQLNLTSGFIASQPITSGTTSNDYWRTILTEVLAQIP